MAQMGQFTTIDQRLTEIKREGHRSVLCRRRKKNSETLAKTFFFSPEITNLRIC